MAPPMRENVPRREFETRRRRGVFSIRRKRDFAWILITVLPFLFAVFLLVFKVRLRGPAAAPVSQAATQAP